MHSHPDDSAFARLERMVEAVVSDPSDREPWQEWYRRCTRDAAELRSDEIRLRHLLGLLRSVRGYGGLVTEAMRMIEAVPLLRVVPSGEMSAPSLTAWLRLRGAPDVPEGLHMPPGGYVLGDGIDGPDGLVSRRPVAVVGTARDVDGGDGYGEVLYRREDGAWESSMVARPTLGDPRSLVGLSARGVHVTADTARPLMAWLDAQEAAAEDLTRRTIQQRTGWLPDLSGWVAGEHRVGREVEVVPLGAGERHRMAGYRSAGTLDGWRREVWGRISEWPAAVAVLASLAAPLLPILQQTGSVLDIGGTSGTGKSTAAAMALSVYGDPDALTYQWHGRAAGLRIGLETHLHVPLVYDDTQQVIGQCRTEADAWRIVQGVVYQVAAGTSDPLGDGQGGTRAVRPVSTILIMTGESPASEHMTAGGAARRMLTMRLSDGYHGVPGGDAGMRQLRAIAREQHGTLGPAWVRWLHDLRPRWPDLRAAYAERVDDVQRAVPGTGRDAGPVAQLELVAYLLGISGLLDVPADTADMARGWLLAETPARDVAAVALASILDYGTARPDQWDGAPAQRSPLLGRQLGYDGGHGGRVAWLYESLSRACTDLGYSVATLLPQWRDRGWLDCEPGQGYRRRVTIGGRSTRCVVLLPPE